MNNGWLPEDVSVAQKMKKSETKGELYNRPGLTRINYRIGAYTHFRDQFMMFLDDERLKDEPSPLRGWTYRKPDDPAIALMEGTSILCDILTFYQNLYANEAYLRTAEWRESISRLVALSGYYLASGFAGEGWFAFEAKGIDGITIPEGFPLKATLGEIDETVDFETSQSILAYPKMNEIVFYHNIESNGYKKSMNEFHIKGPVPFDLIPGDRLLLIYGVEESILLSTQTDAEIVFVDNVWEFIGNFFN